MHFEMQFVLSLTHLIYYILQFALAVVCKLGWYCPLEFLSGFAWPLFSSSVVDSVFVAVEESGILEDD